MKKYLIFDLDWTLINSKGFVDKVILKEIWKVWKEYEKKAIETIEKTQWSSIIEFLEDVFYWSETDIEKISKKIFKKITKKEDDIEFFKWVEKEIKKLHKDYKLFLTTWNYTKFAKDMLKNAWLKKYFEIIKWSSKTPKWQLHLDLFKDYTKDKDFYKNSVYIWDWNQDREFATNAWIDFIHIWDLHEDKYEIESVRFIKKELKEINVQEKPEKIWEEIVFDNKYKKIIKKDYKIRNWEIHNFFVTTQYWTKIATMIFPLTKKWEIVYNKEFRYWVEDFIIWFPIWILEENLSTEENVKKELKEETWYKTSKIEYLWETIWWNFNDLIIKYYLAKDCESWEKSLEDSEYIETFIASKKEFKKMIETWEIKCPLSLACWSLGKNKI